MYGNNNIISKMPGKIKIIEPFVQKLFSMSTWPQWSIRRHVGSSQRRDLVQGRRPTELVLLLQRLLPPNQWFIST